MAIARISGNTLQDNLQRGSNLSVQGNLLYVDVTNDRLGVLTDSPDVEFTVNGSANVTGNLLANNISLSSLSVSGNITGGNLIASGNVSANYFLGNINGSDVIGQVANSAVSYQVNLQTATVDQEYPIMMAVSNSGNAVIRGALGSQPFTYNPSRNRIVVNTISTSTIGTGTVSATGNISGSNLNTAGQVVATGNVSGGNIISSGSVETANITMTGTSVTSDANLSIATSSNGNIDFDIDGSGVVSFNTTTSLTIPAGNTAQRPGSPETGAIRFNNTISQVEVYDGSTWEVVGSDFASITSQEITGDGSTVQFTLNESTTAAAIIVSTNGVVQLPGTAYTVAGNQITFAEAPISSDTIDVRFTSAVTTVTSITNTSGSNTISVLDNGVADISTVQSLQLPTYTVTEANALANVANGQIIYVSNGDSGSPCLAVYSAGAWKISSLGGNITA